ncbi:MAG: tetratricopeptide repeat protein [Deltaproteobacteria bacterium]
MLARALALLSLSLLPPAQQYTWGSFPKGLQAMLGRPRHPDDIFLVRRIPDGERTLWEIGRGCPKGELRHCRGDELVRQEGTSFQKLGPAYTDPLTQRLLAGPDLEALARSDAATHRWAAAAGRLALLCRSGCSAELRALEGTAALAAGYFAEAERAFRAVLAAEPDRALARIALGDALLGQHKNDEARAAYEQATRASDSTAAAEARGRLRQLHPPR